ncbi:MAG: class I SAM-dependent methyltransferase [Planctomycetota bacterium]
MNPNALSTKIIKKGMDFAYGSWANTQRMLGRIDYPVPSFSSMHKTSSKTVKHYYESGIRTAVPILTAARANGLDLKQAKVLDFGCGVGRQLAHMTRHLPENEYYACDIDDLSVSFIQKHYEQVSAYVSSFRPPLAYEDAFFDMIYSVSIFSHLHLDDIEPWLQELARITKPGGLLMLTTEGPTALGPLSEAFGVSEAELLDELQAKGTLYKEYDYLEECLQKQGTLKSASFMIGIEGSYGNTVLSPEHIHREWESDILEVVSVIEGIIDFRQDLVVLRRK